MSKILIAATTVGAAIAGLILYYGKRNGLRTRRIRNASNDAYQNDGPGTIERNAMHSMG